MSANQLMDGDSAVIFIRNRVKPRKRIPGVAWRQDDFEAPLQAVKIFREITKFGLKEANAALTIAQEKWIGVSVQYLDVGAINRIAMLGYEIRLMDVYAELHD